MWRPGGALIALLVFLFDGCAAPSAVPVVERQQPPSEKINTHWVAEGETLYSIAWRYNLDVEQLARANGLQVSRPIYRGQTLRLDLDRALAQRRAKQPARHSASSKPASRQSTAASTAPVAKLTAWRWPAQGKLLKRYSFSGSSGHKGVDIQGRTGQSVYAAQGGVVVYAGSGLPAYGNLLIVRHAGSYLSAYAHNSKLVVREGQQVKGGQKIAEVGQSGTTHQHLHFEIRKHGKPVDPLALLPKA